MPVDPVFIEIGGHAVGRGHHNDPPVEQFGEQAAEQHGVCNVRHLELVEAEQSRRLPDLLCDFRDRVSSASVTERLHCGVHFGHEVVKVDAALRFDLHIREEQVHEHRLAAPDRAMDVETPRRRGLAVETEHGAAPCRHPCLQVVSHAAECGSHMRLRSVARQLSFCDERVVSLNRVHARS